MMRGAAWLIATGSLLAGFGLLIPAQAAPVAGLQVEGSGPRAETVAYRCWRQNGTRRCRWVEPRARGAYGNGYSGFSNGSIRGRPEDYQTGTTDWWRAMDRENRGGFGIR